MLRWTHRGPSQPSAHEMHDAANQLIAGTPAIRAGEGGEGRGGADRRTERWFLPRNCNWFGLLEETSNGSVVCTRNWAR